MPPDCGGSISRRPVPWRADWGGGRKSPRPGAAKPERARSPPSSPPEKPRSRWRYRPSRHPLRSGACRGGQSPSPSMCPLRGGRAGPRRKRGSSAIIAAPCTRKRTGLQASLGAMYLSMVPGWAAVTAASWAVRLSGVPGTTAIRSPYSGATVVNQSIPRPDQHQKKGDHIEASIEMPAPDRDVKPLCRAMGRDVAARVCGGRWRSRHLFLEISV